MYPSWDTERGRQNASSKPCISGSKNGLCKECLSFTQMDRTFLFAQLKICRFFIHFEPKRKWFRTPNGSPKKNTLFYGSPLNGDIPNKYPLYKVYMGLIIKGTIPRVPPFSLWIIHAMAKFQSSISNTALKRTLTLKWRRGWKKTTNQEWMPMNKGMTMLHKGFLTLIHVWSCMYIFSHLVYLPKSMVSWLFIPGSRDAVSCSSICWGRSCVIPFPAVTITAIIKISYRTHDHSRTFSLYDLRIARILSDHYSATSTIISIYISRYVRHCISLNTQKIPLFYSKFSSWWKRPLRRLKYD